MLLARSFYQRLNAHFTAARQNVAAVKPWNTKEEPFVGYVIEMEILDEYGARFTPQTVGSAIHRELWVPSEELAEFNNQLTKPVSVRRA